MMSHVITRDQRRLLFNELRWLMRLRWIAGAALLVAGVLNWQWGRWYPAQTGPVLLACIVLAANAGFWLVLRVRPRLRHRFREIVVFASAQILMDLAALTLVALWTGGLLSPAMGFFVFHMLFAAMLQPRVRAYATAVSAVMMVGSGLWLSGQWPGTTFERQVALGWISTVLITVFLADRITQSLYRREQARVRQVQRIRSMSARLRQQQQALVQSEKMSAMGQFAAGIAHEITNPLASMDSLLQLMQRSAGTTRPEAVARLREQVQRIHRTIRQLTAYAHPGEGRPEPTVVNDLVNVSLDMLAFDKRLDAVVVTRDLGAEAGLALVNPQAIQQVLTNLVLNAIDATMASPEPRITVRTRSEPEWCLVEVEDNGSGIAEQHLPRLFEPFFTTKPVGRGTGLGLSISARLVRDGGGEISVSSRVGHGSTFTLRLPPVVQAASSRATSNGTSAERALTAPRGEP